ncbi:tetratricopeptide repeat protein [Leptolyngbyaceae cyanobacterium CCMR0082]|uniref:Tetratricopeptide repeat protein n=2 Tax=Adonisia TaxID=2950183 RepID=A0A6M0S7E6_9CYAN|nr:tetratricopeptide repeat protein [Adonisia turfae CCMR0082]
MIGPEQRRSFIFASILAPRTDKEFHDQLSVWGHYRQVLQLCEMLVDSCDDYTKIVCWLRKGGIYQLFLNDYPQAVEFYKKGLKGAKELPAPDLELAALLDLGSAYRRLGKTQTSMRCFQNALELANKIGAKKQKANALSFMGLIHSGMENYTKAVDFYEQSIKIIQEVGDAQIEADTLNNLGVNLIQLGQNDQAFQNIQKALEISKQASIPYSEAWCKRNLGILLTKQKEYSNANAAFNEALEIFEGLNNYAGQCEVLESLSGLNYEQYQ